MRITFFGLRNKHIYNEMHFLMWFGLGVYMIFVHLDEGFIQQVGVHRRDHQPAEDGPKASGD